MKKSNAILLIVALLGLLIILISIFVTIFFELDLVENLIFGWGITIIYALFALILMRKAIYLSVEIKTKEIIREVEKPVYIEESKKKLVIPKYDYVASSQTQTYHKRTCRLSKLIKKKFKIQNNDASFFVKNKFKPCKICIKK